MSSRFDADRRVVITGLGILSPIGIGKDAFWSSALAGQSGIATSQELVDHGLNTTAMGIVTGTIGHPKLVPGKLKRLDRMTQLAMVAACEALDDCGGFGGANPEDIAVVVGSGVGGHETMEDTMRRANAGRPIHPMSLPRTMGSAAGAHIAEIVNGKGPNMTINTACSSGINAIGTALDLIRSGRARKAVVGGVEACSRPFMVVGFSALRALSTGYNDQPMTASRPFDKGRDGFILSEGAAMFTLELESDARAAGKTIYAALDGFGSSCNANDIVVPDVNGEIQAMTAALLDADCSPDGIDYLNPHATSTPLGDKVEVEAIKAVFSERAASLPISATKSLIGHSIGASGAIGLAATVLSMRDNRLHPTINYETPDPECDLDFVPNVARDHVVNGAMVNAFGFGGNNASLVVNAVQESV